MGGNYAMFSFFVNIGGKFSDDFMNGVEVVRKIQEKWCNDNNIHYLKMDALAYSKYDYLRGQNPNWGSTSFLPISDYLRAEIMRDLLGTYESVCYIDSDILLFDNFDINDFFDLTSRNKRLSIYREYWFHDIDSYLMNDGDKSDYLKPVMDPNGNLIPYVDVESFKLNPGLCIFNNNFEHIKMLGDWSNNSRRVIEGDRNVLEEDFTIVGPKYVSENFCHDGVSNIIPSGIMLSPPNEYHIQHDEKLRYEFFSIWESILGNKPSFMNLSTLSLMTSWHGVIDAVRYSNGVYGYSEEMINNEYPYSGKCSCTDLDKVYYLRFLIEENWRKYGINKNEILINYHVGRHCNFSCTYCFDDVSNKTQFDQHEVDVDSVVRFVTGLKRPVLFHLTGGEPMIAKNMINLVAKLIDLGHKVSMVTNLSWDVSKLIESCSKHESISMCASYHIEELERKNMTGRFISNFKKLKDSGVLMRAFAVAHPSYTSIDTIKRAGGIPFEFTPFVGVYQGKTYPASYTGDEINYFGMSRRFEVSKKESNDPEEKRCNAGRDSIIVDSLGDVYPCSDLYFNTSPREKVSKGFILGNIHKGNVSLNIDYLKCPQKHCYCPYQTKRL